MYPHHPLTEMDKEATWLIDEQFLKEKCETYFSRLTKEGMGFSHTKKRKYCMDELWSHYKLFVPSWDNVEGWFVVFVHVRKLIHLLQ